MKKLPRLLNTRIAQLLDENYCFFFAEVTVRLATFSQFEEYLSKHGSILSYEIMVTN